MPLTGDSLVDVRCQDEAYGGTADAEGPLSPGVTACTWGWLAVSTQQGYLWAWLWGLRPTPA